MKTRWLVVISLLIWSGFAGALTGVTSDDNADDETSLNQHLQPLAPYVGKTWKGAAPNSTEEKPVYDVSRWERALNGQAIRILHSINDGAYGGESLIIWDPDKEKLVFYYFTTEGFYTNGTITVEDGNFVSHEVVTGEESGVTEVKATSVLLPDGRLHSKSQYLKNGEWVDGHEFIYEEDPTAEVVFR